MPISPISNVRSPCHTRIDIRLNLLYINSLCPPSFSGKIAPDIDARGLNFSAKALYPPGAIYRLRIFLGSTRLIVPMVSYILFLIRYIRLKNPYDIFISAPSAIFRCFWKCVSLDVMFQP